MMRSVTSLFVAVVCHAGLFGIGALVARSPERAEVRPPDRIEMEIVAAKPDLIADTPPEARTDEPPRPRAAPRPRVKSQPPALAPVDRAAPTEAPAIEPRPKAPDVVSPKAVVASPAPSPTFGRPVDGVVGSSARPRYRNNPKPDYPLASLRRHEEGIVLLNVQVEADGRPSAITLKQSSGHPLLDASALDAVRRWTFEPARAGGIPVSSLAIVPVRFSTAEQ